MAPAAPPATLRCELMPVQRALRLLRLRTRQWWRTGRRCTRRSGHLSASEQPCSARRQRWKRRARGRTATLPARGGKRRRCWLGRRRRRAPGLALTSSAARSSSHWRLPLASCAQPVGMPPLQALTLLRIRSTPTRHGQRPSPTQPLLHRCERSWRQHKATPRRRCSGLRRRRRSAPLPSLPQLPCATGRLNWSDSWPQPDRPSLQQLRRLQARRLRLRRARRRPLLPVQAPPSALLQQPTMQPSGRALQRHRQVPLRLRPLHRRRLLPCAAAVAAAACSRPITITMTHTCTSEIMIIIVMMTAAA